MVKMSISEKTLRMNAEIPILPVLKTDDMTQPVGRDPGGRLWTRPGGKGSALPEYTAADEGKVLMIVGGKPTWVTIKASTTEEITLAVNEDGSILLSGVELVVQDDGAVLIGGAELVPHDDGAVMIR